MFKRFLVMGLMLLSSPALSQGVGGGGIINGGPAGGNFTGTDASTLYRGSERPIGVTEAIRIMETDGTLSRRAQTHKFNGATRSDAIDRAPLAS